MAPVPLSTFWRRAFPSYIAARTGELAYFKPLRTPGSFLEYATYRIGRSLGLPIPECVPVVLPDGEAGLASLLLPSPFLTWQMLPRTLSAADIAARIDVPLLAGLVVFDWWLGNTDRHDGNILLRSAAGGRWQLIFIDHNGACHRGNWLNEGDTEHRHELFAPLGRFVYAVNERLAQAVRIAATAERLRPWQEAISADGTRMLRESAEAAPLAFAGTEMRARFVAVLDERRTHLDSAVAAWLREG